VKKTGFDEKKACGARKKRISKKEGIKTGYKGTDPKKGGRLPEKKKKEPSSKRNNWKGAF